jgi:hypothetical protein
MASLRRALRAGAVLWFCVGTLPHAMAAQAGARAPAAAAAAGAMSAGAMSADAFEMARWVAESRDHGGLPFAVVDKKGARAYVFTAQGRLAGASAVLLGAGVGDRAKRGLGKLPVASIPRADRKTPAGRFESFPGENLDGEDVVWFDYDEGLAIHRLRPNALQGARRERLASRDAAAHRVSAGCVVVPVAFYESVVRPLLGRGRSTLYVLPEERPVQDFIAALRDD